MRLSANQTRKLAARWACSVRTIQRMRARGVDVFSTPEVLDYVSKSRTATAAQLEAALREAVNFHDEELERITSNGNEH